MQVLAAHAAAGWQIPDMMNEQQPVLRLPQRRMGPTAQSALAHAYGLGTQADACSLWRTEGQLPTGPANDALAAVMGAISAGRYAS